MEPISFTTIVVLALLAFIIGLLIKIIADLRKLIEAGAHDGPTQAGLHAVGTALNMVQEIRARENPKPTKAECETLKTLLDEAIAGNVSQLTLAPLHTAITTLCGS